MGFEEFPLPLGLICKQSAVQISVCPVDMLCDLRNNTADQHHAGDSGISGENRLILLHLEDERSCIHPPAIESAAPDWSQNTHQDFPNKTPDYCQGKQRFVRNVSPDLASLGISRCSFQQPGMHPSCAIPSLPAWEEPEPPISSLHSELSNPLCQSKHRALCSQHAVLPAPLSLPPPIVTDSCDKSSRDTVSVRQVALVSLSLFAVSHTICICTATWSGMEWGTLRPGEMSFQLHNPAHAISPPCDFITAKSCVIELSCTL